MSHLQYNELTEHLSSLTEKAKQLRAVFPRTDEARTNPLFSSRWQLLDNTQRGIDEAGRLMTDCGDGFIEDLKSQGKNLNPDIKRLVEAMDGFVAIASTPIPGMAGLFANLLGQCRDWMEQYQYQVGNLNNIVPSPAERNKTRVEEFKPWLRERDEYKDAVKDGRISNGFVWDENQTKVGLARFLQPLLTKFYKGRDYWTYADNLFTYDGVQISSKQLSKLLNK